MSMVINGAIYPKRAMNSSNQTITSQSLTVSTAAVSPVGYTATPAVDGVSVVTFDVSGADVRCFWEGSTPTSTVGHFLPATSAYTWDTTQYNNAKFIRDTTATADAVITASPMSIS